MYCEGFIIGAMIFSMDQQAAEDLSTLTKAESPSKIKSSLIRITQKFRSLPKPVIFFGFILVGILSVYTFSVIWKTQEKEPELIPLNGKPVIMSDREISMNAQRKDSIGVESDTGFTLASEKPLDAEKIKQSLLVSPEVPIGVTKVSDYEVEVKPQQNLENNTVYTFSLTKGAVEGVDDTIPYKWAFQTKDTFSITTSIPRHQATYVPLDAAIELTFSHDNYVDPLEYVSISPPIELVFERHKKTAVFIPAKLEPSTVYTFTISGSLPIKNSDETLGKDVVIKFETTGESTEGSDSYKQYFDFSKQSVEVAPGVIPAVGVYAYQYEGGGVNSLDVEVYKYPTTVRFLEEIANRDSIPTWSARQWDTYQADVTGLEKVASFTTDVQPAEYQGYILFPEALPLGQYVALAKNETHSRSVLIQVTTLTAYHTVANNTSIVWLNSTDTHQPISSGRVTVLPDTVVGETNSDGMLQFDSSIVLQDTSKQQYVLIEQGTMSLIVPSRQGYYGPYAQYGFGDYWGTDSDYWSYLYVDRPIYQQTDTVNFWGILKHRDIPNKHGESYVQLVRPNESATVRRQRVTISNYGTYEGNLSFQNVTPAYYYVELVVDGKTVETQYVHIKPYTKPAYTISLAPDKRGVFAGDTVTFSGEVRFYNGAPVSNIVLEYQSNEVKADENGKFSFNHTPKYGSGSYPSSERFTIGPKLSSEAEIQASSSLTVFGPKYDISTETDYPSDTDFIARATISEIDIAAFNAGDTYKKKLSTSVEVKGTVEESHFEKKEIGQAYDFVNKKVVKRYRYDTVRRTVDTFSQMTNAAGVVEYRRSFEPNVWYKVTFTVTDGDGRTDSEDAHAYHWARYNTSYSNQGFSLRQHSQTGSSSGYSVGEPVTLEAFRDDVSMENTGDKKFLFIKAQRGIRTASVQASPLYTFTFGTGDMPNIAVVGIHFDGTTYETIQETIQVNTESRTLAIDIEEGKTKYAPGETVNLNIQTRNANGAGVPAMVNFSVVDEAIFGLSEQHISPVSSLYKTVVSGIVSSYATHQYPIDRSAGEMGSACFIGDTEVKISPTESKPIKDIKKGDVIYTFGSDISSGLTADEVTGVDVHTVSHLLVINGTLKVTPEHVVYLNNQWKPIGSAQVGDILTNEQGKSQIITSISHEYGAFTVYNLHVKDNHTFIAGGVYVHNSKDGIRSVFVDTPYFGSITTNANGRGSTSFTLPDNLTEWRITYHGVTNDLLVGSGKSAVFTSKPVFVQPSLNTSYVLGDKPKVSLRTFGTALTSNDVVNYEVSIPSLGWDTPQTHTSKAFEEVLINLPDLVIGKHEITISAITPKGSDVVKRSFEVLPSRANQRFVENVDIENGAKLTNPGKTSTVTISNARRNRYYAALNQIASFNGERVDFAVSRRLASQILTDYFAQQLVIPEFEPGEYQVEGVSLLPYSATDPVLSARLAMAAESEFDVTALSRYFNSFRIKDVTSYDELTASMLGSAALHEPVLQEIYAALDELDLTIDQRLRLVAGLTLLGDFDRAYSEYADILSSYGEDADPYVRIVSGDSQDDSIVSTAIALIAASGLGDTNAEAMFRYITEFSTTDSIIHLEILKYISSILPTLSTDTSAFTYTLDGQATTIELPDGGSHSFVVNPSQIAGLEFSNTVGEIGATVEWYGLFQSSPDTHVKNVSRTIRAGDQNAQQSEQIYEDSIVRVEIHYAIENPPEGCYSVIDYVPSGLKAVSRSYRDYGYVPQDQIYPYRIDENAVYYCIPIKADARGTISGTLTYFARVSAPGVYVFEGTVFQSDKIVSDRAKGPDTTITINPR